MVLAQDDLDTLRAILERDGLELDLTINGDQILAQWFEPDNQIAVGQFTFTLSGPQAVFEVLSFRVDYRDVGFYRHLILLLPDWTRALGITNWRIPFTLGDEFRNDALDTGFEPEEPGSVALVVTVSDPATSRLDQYNRWVQGNIPEPDWHQQLSPETRRTH